MGLEHGESGKHRRKRTCLNSSHRFSFKSPLTSNPHRSSSLVPWSFRGILGMCVQLRQREAQPQGRASMCLRGGGGERSGREGTHRLRCHLTFPLSRCQEGSRPGQNGCCCLGVQERILLSHPITPSPVSATVPPTVGGGTGAALPFNRSQGPCWFP